MGVFAWLSRHRLGAGPESSTGWGWPTHGFAASARTDSWGMAVAEPEGTGPEGRHGVRAHRAGGPGEAELREHAEPEERDGRGDVEVEAAADGWPTDHPLLGRRPSAIRSSVSELVSECEAVVVGRYAEVLIRQAKPVPVWAWTNLLAHGSLAVLQHEARTPVAIGPDHAWRAARSYLATELVARCPDEQRLTDLQVSVLRPLELDLAARGPSWHADSRGWAIEVLSSLNRPTQERRRAKHR